MAGLVTRLRYAVHEWRTWKKDIRVFREFVTSPGDEISGRASPIPRLLMILLSKFQESDTERVELRLRDCAVDCSAILPDRLPRDMVAFWPALVASAFPDSTDREGHREYRIPFAVPVLCQLPLPPPVRDREQAVETASLPFMVFSKIRAAPSH